MRTFLVVFAIAIVLLPNLSVEASGVAASDKTAVPRVIRFSGTILDPSGKPQTGTLGAIFAIYPEQTGGAPLWTETQNVELDARGHYTVLLGASHTDGLPAELFNTGEARWLGVQAQVAGAPEQTRVLLVSVPYAMKAGDAETLGGKPLSSFVLADPGTAKSQTTSNSSKALRETTAAINNGGSNGTVNYVAKFDSASTVVNSTIFDDGTNVGIGTTTPASKLDVNGTVNFSATQSGSGGSYDFWPFIVHALDTHTGGGHNTTFGADIEAISTATGGSQVAVGGAYIGATFAPESGNASTDYLAGLEVGVSLGGFGSVTRTTTGITIDELWTEGIVPPLNLGLNIDDITHGTVNYSIFTGLGKVHFGDNVELASGKSIAADSFIGTLVGNVSGNVSGNAATVTNGVVTTAGYVNPNWITSLDASKLTGTANNILYNDRPNTFTKTDNNDCGIGLSSYTVTGSFVTFGGNGFDGFRGETSHPCGNAVEGVATGVQGAGVYGQTYGANGWAVYGESNDTTGTGHPYAVYGLLDGPTGVAVAGISTSTDSPGNVIGVQGVVSHPNGIAGVFDNTAGGKIFSGQQNGVERISIGSTGNVITQGTVSANAFVGSGAGLINVPVTALTGTVSPANIGAGTAAINVNGNAATATRLAANGTTCADGSFAQGVDSFGNAVGCAPAASAAPNYVFATDHTGPFVQLTGESNPTFSPVTFDTNVKIDNWTHTTGTSDFIANQSGVYLVQYSAGFYTSPTSPDPASGIEIQAVRTTPSASAMVPDSNVAAYNLNPSLTNVSKSFIVDMTAGDSLKLQWAELFENEIACISSSQPATNPIISMTITRIQ